MPPTEDPLRSRSRAEWRSRARFFHEEDTRYLRFLIPPGRRVLEIGCGAGHTLAALEPSAGVGVDSDAAVIEEGRAAFPHLELLLGDVEDERTLAKLQGPFDAILVVDTLGAIRDCQQLLTRLHRFCTRETRLVIAHDSHLWHPLLKLAEAVGRKRREGPRNVFSPADVQALAALADFDPVRSERRLLSPRRLLGLGRLANRFLAGLPLLRHLDLRHYVVCRPRVGTDGELRSATVVIPVRNERGNVEPAIQRMPRFADDLEILFVEGRSGDGTLTEVERVRAERTDWDIGVMTQPGIGKADAVFAAFDAARGDVLLILDGDLTVAPEELPKFWEAIRSGRGELVCGSRLVYPMDDEAMRFLNLLGNRFFSLLFSWILNQRHTDTLCGTKALRRRDYLRLKAERAFFGDFDPFGDFDLILGASRLSLKTIEIPIRYAARSYGSTQISRFRHGWLLLRMVGFAFLRIKAI